MNPCGPPVPTLSASTLTSFGNVCINTTAGPNSFTITGTTLTNANVTVAALTGFSYATAAGGLIQLRWSPRNPVDLFATGIRSVQPNRVQSYNGNIVVGGGGAPSINVAAGFRH